MPIVTLTTDFGLQDHYVASMKGVLLGVAPKTTLVDVTHEIGAHDVLQAAFVLNQIWDHYPVGTIHVVVVDPGVGTSRRALAGRYGGRIVLAPDNGVVSLVHRRVPIEEMRVVENHQLFRSAVSSTFHGRDVFAPLAGHLAKGGRLSDVGPATDHVQILQLPEAVIHEDHSLSGEVISVDRFGSLVTNIKRADLALVYNRRGSLQVYVEETLIGPVRNAYGEVDVGMPLALIGSTDLLEVAVNQASAAERFQAGLRTVVHVK